MSTDREAWKVATFHEHYGHGSGPWRSIAPDTRGTCDRCGVHITDHAGATPDDRHAYTSAADDALRHLRKARFAGCADDLGRREYDPVTRSYRTVGFETDVNECAHPECFLGPHVKVMYTWCPPDDHHTARCDGWHTHDYMPPDDGTRLVRMLRRRSERAYRRRIARGWEVGR